MPSTFTHTPALSSADEVRKLRDRLDKDGKRLVLTNGCFDLLHAGHVRYLQQARALGDALVVALNSDESVRALKGPTRPLNTEEDRAEVLKALRCVDAVCVFREERATNLIEQVKPHVYAKGGDYTIASLNPEERAALDFVGAEIEILSLVPGRSTTNIIKRMTGEPEAAEEVKPAAGFKLGLLGSGEGSNFKAILNAVKSGELDAQIACVISDQPESGIVKAAREAELTVFVVNPGEKTKGFPENAQKEVCEHLQRAGVDLVVLCGFMRILREPVLSAFKDKIINVHPSLLPRYKGSQAVLQALDDGELETGTTVHLVTAAVDGGRVLAQAKVPIEIGDTEETLHQRIKLEEHKLLPQVIARWIAEGGAPAA